VLSVLVVRWNYCRFQLHADVIRHLKVVHVCKDIGIDYLQQVYGCSSYDRVVPVSSIYVSIPFCGLSTYALSVFNVRIRGFVMDPLESDVVAVVVHKAMYCYDHSAPINRYLIQLSIVDLS